MSRQVNFIVVQKDLQQLLEFAEQNGFQALPMVMESDEIPIVRRPTDPKFEHWDDYFYLMPREFAPVEAFYLDLPFHPGLARMSDETSPVIQVQPTRVVDDRPVEGRIYHCQESTDSRYSVALKGYNLLASFIMRWPKAADGRRYLGPHAALILAKDSRH